MGTIFFESFVTGSFRVPHFSLCHFSPWLSNQLGLSVESPALNEQMYFFFSPRHLGQLVPRALISLDMLQINRRELSSRLSTLSRVSKSSLRSKYIWNSIFKRIVYIWLISLLSTVSKRGLAPSHRVTCQLMPRCHMQTPHFLLRYICILQHKTNIPDQPLLHSLILYTFYDCENRNCEWTKHQNWLNLQFTKFIGNLSNAIRKPTNLDEVL